MRGKVSWKIFHAIVITTGIQSMDLIWDGQLFLSAHFHNSVRRGKCAEDLLMENSQSCFQLLTYLEEATLI